MRKTREQKAITLIALIITIVVLLILAVVAINAVTGDEIIQHATNAKTKYEKAQNEENSMISYYQTYLDTEGQVGKWIQTNNSLKKVNEDGSVDEIKIGDFVNYTSNTNSEIKWRVLGIENNQILLLSATNVVTNYTLYGAADYLNNVGINKLNTECQKYINDTYATKARSINVDDVNKLTGYAPETEFYGRGELYQYGNEVTYTLTANNEIEVTSATKNVKFVNQIGFKLPDGTELTTTKPITLKSTSYSYYPSELGTTTDSGVDEMLFENTNKENGEYWLASTAIATSSGAGFLMRSVHDSHVGGKYLYNSGNNNLEYTYCGIRAIIYLKSDVELEKVNGVWNFKSE